MNILKSKNKKGLPQPVSLRIQSYYFVT